MAAYIQQINVAQINDALVTYQADQTIVSGLTALKNTIIGAIDDPKDCPQCTHSGKIEDGDTICPLCKGQTKTSGQYGIIPVTVRFEKL